MPTLLRIAMIGERDDAGIAAHRAMPLALSNAAAALGKLTTAIATVIR